MNYRSVTLCLLVFLSFFILACTEDRESVDQATTENNQANIDTSYAHSDFVSFSPDAATGAVVYIPVYSHIYQRDAQRTFNLTTTLSIRNTDLESPITITKVYYYDSQGNLVQKYLDSPEEVKPISSISYVVEEDDLRGGVGANFLLIWEADDSVTQPVIESVMISAAQNQGISFLSEGRVIRSLDRDSEE